MLVAYICPNYSSPNYTKCLIHFQNPVIQSRITVYAIWYTDGEKLLLHPVHSLLFWAF